MDNNNYQEPAQPTEQEAKLTDMQTNSGEYSPGDLQAQNERVMFEQHVSTNGVEIPQNFKTAGDWFNSLKEAQGQYTQARQEISDLKNTYATEGAVNPNYQEPTQGQPAPPVVEAPVSTGTEELRIQQPEPEPVVPEPTPSNITNEMWQSWGNELAVQGDLTEETKNSIKQTTGFSDHIINDFVTGQKAKMREAYDGAAELIGGRDKLANIFKWAETLSAEEQATINTGLSSPSYEVTLRGLESMYNSRSVEAVKAQEPVPNANMGQVAASEGGYTSYTTQREFKQDRNNPRFKMEPAFREAVEQRMMRTDFNRLPM
jgi:hypothetical protein